MPVVDEGNQAMKNNWGKWVIRNVLSRKAVETHQNARDVQRAHYVLSAHAKKIGMVGMYEIEPPLTDPLPLRDLNLPGWALEAMGEMELFVEQANRDTAEVEVRPASAWGPPRSHVFFSMTDKERRQRDLFVEQLKKGDRLLVVDGPKKGLEALYLEPDLENPWLLRVSFQGIQNNLHGAVRFDFVEWKGSEP